AADSGMLLINQLPQQAAQMIFSIAADHPAQAERNPFGQLLLNTLFSGQESPSCIAVRLRRILFGMDTLIVTAKDFVTGEMDQGDIVWGAGRCNLLRSQCQLTQLSRVGDVF